MRTSIALGLMLLSGAGMASDLNGDGAVDLADLDVMRSVFYTHDARADLNHDGIVNFADLAILKSAMVGAAPAAPFVAPTVFMDPASLSVAPNGTVTIDLRMDFTQEATLGGGTDITFDPTRLTYVGFTFDSALGDDPAFRRVPDLQSPGLLNALAFGSFDGLTGPARVGTFTFQATSTQGTTSLTMDADEPDGEAGPFVSFVTFQEMAVVFTGASVTVGGPNISASPLPVDLGNVRVGQTEQKQLTVTNTGFANLVTGVVGNTDPLAAPFSIAGNTCNNRTLAPNASCTLNVRLQGTAQGTKNDSFNIPSNDPDAPNLTVATTGVVVQKVGVQPITGVATTTATCTNQTTGQTVNITLSGATSLNCETAGLSPLAPGSVVVIQINGTRSTGSVVGGTVRSMGLTQVTCQNLTTGQNRTFDPAPPGPTPRNWNCLGGGWSATNGQSVRMTVRGAAD
jgi:hypothetical protein